MGQERCFFFKPWIGQGLVEREPSLTEKVFFLRLHCAGVLRKCQFEIICVSKKGFCLHFAKGCVPSLWNACFCSLIAYQGGSWFSARFLGREQFGGNSVNIFSFGASSSSLSTSSLAVAPHQPKPSFLLCFFFFVCLSFSYCFCCCSCKRAKKITQKQKNNSKIHRQKTLFLQGLGAFGGRALAKETPKKKQI